MKSNTILLVEDELLIQKVEALLLEQNGFNVDIASNGAQAMNKAIQQTYLLVLMDLGLPDNDGLIVTRHLRQNFSARTLPIIALTAHDSQDVQNACYHAGMNGFICKPLTQEKLLATITHFQDLR